ncbi:MAG: cysteine desulfurase family protein [Bacillota bacterium]
MPEIYLDNSATTRPYPEVVDLMQRIMAKAYGNPSSLHEKGLEAERHIEEARRQIASFFSGREREIIFTSGGTESNNLAIKGAALRNRNRGSHLITSQVEHPSVLNCFRFLEENGFRVTYLPVNEQGLADLNKLAEEICEETILVSIMHVNNEVGTVQPLEKIGPLLKKKHPGLLFHVDAVQSFGRLPLKIRDWQVDMVSCSGHKVHGPRGAGSLWVKGGTLLQPVFHGGGQERELRPGTQNTPAIAGFGLAARFSGENQAQKKENLQNLKLRFYRKLLDSGIELDVNGPPPEEGASHIINLSFPGLPSEMLLHSLEAKGVFASAGSACHSRKAEPSHILQALGLKKSLLDSALRFSFSCYNSEQEIEKAAAIVSETVNELYTIIK